MKLKTTILFTILLSAASLHTQELENSHQKRSFYLGVYAPYVLQSGARAGISLPIKTWSSQTRRQNTRLHSLDITPRIGYFAEAEVQQNYHFELLAEYRWFRPDRGIHPKIGLGMGYILARQNTEGSLDLGSGEIEFDTRSLNFLCLRSVLVLKGIGSKGSVTICWRHLVEDLRVKRSIRLLLL